ncbi:MAG: 50S ribosomal protein L23 [Bacteroidota bacterium]
MNILKQPLVTKKLSDMNSENVYGLIVDNKANKIEIKKIVEQLYGVTVVQVNTIRCAGKNKTRYTKRGLRQNKQAAYKKALITIKAGDVIDFYSHV